jgi:hypothetical protein
MHVRTHAAELSSLREAENRQRSVRLCDQGVAMEVEVLCIFLIEHDNDNVNVNENEMLPFGRYYSLHESVVVAETK